MLRDSGWGADPCLSTLSSSVSWELTALFTAVILEQHTAKFCFGLWPCTLGPAPASFQASARSLRAPGAFPLGPGHGPRSPSSLTASHVRRLKSTLEGGVVRTLGAQGAPPGAALTLLTGQPPLQGCGFLTPHGATRKLGVPGWWAALSPMHP